MSFENGVQENKISRAVVATEHSLREKQAAYVQRDAEKLKEENIRLEEELKFYRDNLITSAIYKIESEVNGTGKIDDDSVSHWASAIKLGAKRYAQHLDSSERGKKYAGVFAAMTGKSSLVNKKRKMAAAAPSSDVEKKSDDVESKEEKKVEKKTKLEKQMINATIKCSISRDEKSWKLNLTGEDLIIIWPKDSKSEFEKYHPGYEFELLSDQFEPTYSKFVVIKLVNITSNDFGILYYEGDLYKILGALHSRKDVGSFEMKMTFEYKPINKGGKIEWRLSDKQYKSFFAAINKSGGKKYDERYANFMELVEKFKKMLRQVVIDE